MTDCSKCIVREACRDLPKDLTCEEVMKVVAVDGQQAIDWGVETGDISVYSIVDRKDGEQE